MRAPLGHFIFFILPLEFAIWKVSLTCSSGVMLVFTGVAVSRVSYHWTGVGSAVAGGTLPRLPQECGAWLGPEGPGRGTAGGQCTPVLELRRTTENFHLVNLNGASLYQKLLYKSVQKSALDEPCIYSRTLALPLSS